LIIVTVDIERGCEKKQYKVTLQGEKAESAERILLAADRKDSTQKPQEILEEVLLSGLRSVISARDVTC
jgi:hypothetical protein